MAFDYKTIENLVRMAREAAQNQQQPANPQWASLLEQLGNSSIDPDPGFHAPQDVANQANQLMQQMGQLSPSSQPTAPKRDQNAVNYYRDSAKKMQGMKPGDAGWNENRNVVKTLGRDLGFNYKQYLPKQERQNPRDPKEVARYQAAVQRISGLDPKGKKFERTSGIINDLGSKYGFQYQNKIPKAKGEA